MYKVLMVSQDQNQLNTLTAVIALQSSHLQIVDALCDSKNVLPFLENSSVDILILDMHCPSMDSIELLRQIRLSYTNVHCIITAEYADFDCVQKVIPLGIENYLLKPLDPQILSETILNTVQKLHLEYSAEKKDPSYTHIANSSPIPSGADQTFFIDPKFKQMMLHQDYAGCLEYFDNLFFGCNQSPAIQRNLIVELVVYIINVMRDYNINISKIINDSAGLFYQILNFQDVYELHFWMKNFLAAAIEELEAKNLHYSPCIARAVMHIKKNFAQDISLKTMACDLNINAAYLGQLFKTETGQLFSVFLNQTRIEHAQELLLSTSLPLNEISQKCGYANISYFYNIFKKHTGKTPTQYRKTQTK